MWRKLKYNLGIIANLKKELYLILKLVVFVDKNYKKTYFPENQKNKIKIKIEIIRWFFKEKEFNKNYFVYGFDSKEKNLGIQDKYLSYRKFRNLRELKNNKTKFKDHRVILRDKFIFHNYVNGLNVETPSITHICDSNGLKELSTSKNIPWESFRTTKVICKTFDGEEADGVFTLEIKEKSLVYINNKKVSLLELKEKLRNEKYFIQEFLKQNKILNSLYSKSVNTIRLVTYMDTNGEVQIHDGLLKIAMNGNVVDNWHLGGIICGINLETGYLNKQGLLTLGYGKNVLTHPDTEIEFGTIKIPFIDRIKDEAIRLHENLYNIHSIGWDIAIGETGPVFIEGNDNWDFSMFQALKGPQKNKTLEILGGER